MWNSKSCPKANHKMLKVYPGTSNVTQMWKQKKICTSNFEGFEDLHQRSHREAKSSKRLAVALGDRPATAWQCAIPLGHEHRQILRSFQIWKCRKKHKNRCRIILNLFWIQLSNGSPCMPVAIYAYGIGASKDRTGSLEFGGTHTHKCSHRASARQVGLEPQTDPQRRILGPHYDLSLGSFTGDVPDHFNLSSPEYQWLLLFSISLPILDTPTLTKSQMVAKSQPFPVVLTCFNMCHPQYVQLQSQEPTTATWLGASEPGSNGGG